MLKNKQLYDLSSGQRRVALIDFISAVLKDKEFDKKKNLILAIDEPEISLDASKKMFQFDKLVQMSENGVSILFSSHWYGWIASTSIGRSILVEEKEDEIKRSIKVYNNSEFPFKDVSKYEMRMIFDFLMSLGASVEAEKNKKFIICEGKSDLFYLSASLDNSIYKIIPIGKGRVKKIADIFKDYFWKDRGPVIKNVLFIIDTDPHNRDNYGNIYLKRWEKDNDNVITLISGQTDNVHIKCIIEDVLENSIYFKSLKEVYPNELIQKLEIKYENISGYESFGMDNVEKKKFTEITKDKKIELAMKYKEILLESNLPENKIKTLVENAFNNI